MSAVILTAICFSRSVELHGEAMSERISIYTSGLFLRKGNFLEKSSLLLQIEFHTILYFSI